MERDSHPPLNAVPPLSPQRQKILDMALTQLQKTRKSIDPALLNKIRNVVEASPALMAQIGAGKAKKAATHEVIDQAKMMEVMAKLMAIKPSGKEQIKLAIKEATK